MGTFAPFRASGEFVFEILRSLSVACVNVFSGDRVFDGPREEGSTVRCASGFFRPAPIFFHNFDRHFGTSQGAAARSVSRSSSNGVHCSVL